MTEELIDLTADGATETDDTVMEIDVSEAVGWTSGETTMHISLAGRDEENQHPISAIAGLQDELTALKSLKTVYSDKVGMATYYKWAEGHRYDDAGYFVSLVPTSSEIQICTGSDIFGVTVPNAAFIGNQDATTVRDNSYGLVVTSGIVDVRCDSEVAIGDNIISSAIGIATTTDSGYGYKVIALEEKDDGIYAVISLGVQACTTDAMGQKIQHLEKQVSDAAVNIASVQRIADEAYSKASSTENQATQDLTDIAEKVDNANFNASGAQQNASHAILVAEQAQEISSNALVTAQETSSELEQTHKETLAQMGEIEQSVAPLTTWEDPVSGNVGAEYLKTYINNGLATKVEIQAVETATEDNKLSIQKNAENFQQMLSSVDKYSVGEYSQAYGLTLAQAQSILKDGMVYIPTQHDGIDTHTENYGDDCSRTFTYGYYYIWSSLTDGGTMWSERMGKVWFSTEQPSGNEYTYWYNGDKLYVLDNEQYIEVAVLAGNVNNRITSMIRQTAEKIAMDVVDAQGNIASHQQWLDNNSANIQDVVSWKSDVEDDVANIATIKQTADAAGSSISQVAANVGGYETWDGSSERDTTKIYYYDSDKKYYYYQDDSWIGTTDPFEAGVVINAASIVTAVNNAESSVVIDADHILFTAEDYQVIADNIELEGLVTIQELAGDGTTEINGANITTGVLQSANYKTTGGAEGVQLNLEDGTWDSPNFTINSAGEVTAKNANIDGTITALNGKIGQFTIEDGYMNLMVSGPKNLVRSGDDPKTLYCKQKDAYVEYKLFTTSNNGSMILDDYGYIVPGVEYTIAINFKVTTLGLYTPDDAAFKVTVYDQTNSYYTLATIPFEKTDQIYKVLTTFKMDSKYSDSPYISNMPGNHANYAPVRLRTNYGVGSSAYIDIYEVKIVEGNHLDDIDDSGLVTSDFANDERGMSWTITPDKCVWWNQAGSLADPLMRLDSDGLYVKGEIEATGGVFDNCTINDTCTINGELSAVTGTLGCLHIDDSKEVHYTLDGETTKSFYIHPQHGVSILKGSIGGWNVDESFKHLASTFYTTNNMATSSSVTAYTKFTPEFLKVVENNGKEHYCSWLSIINAINPPTASVE